MRSVTPQIHRASPTAGDVAAACVGEDSAAVARNLCGADDNEEDEANGGGNLLLCEVKEAQYDFVGWWSY